MVVRSNLAQSRVEARRVIPEAVRAMVGAQEDLEVGRRALRTDPALGAPRIMESRSSGMVGGWGVGWGSEERGVVGWAGGSGGGGLAGSSWGGVGGVGGGVGGQVARDGRWELDGGGRHWCFVAYVVLVNKREA